MKVAISGAYGFLGWHTACRLRALHGTEPIRLGRADMADAALLAQRLAGVDTILHVAGVNRGPDDEVVEEGNVQVAEVLSGALDLLGQPIDVVFANSVQSELNNAYGRGKRRASHLLAEKVRASGGNFADLLLPNLFGEHGRPAYNSFVATFVHEVIAGRRPQVTADRDIQLLHAQDAAAALIDAIGRDGQTLVEGEPTRISAVLSVFDEIHGLYADRGEIPDLSTPLRRNLFNTYRAATFPDMWPIRPTVHSDPRGDLFETVRSHGGAGMSYASITRPGQKRGEHYHLHKVERFMVIQGEAEIQLRRLLHDDVVTFHVSGSEPQFIDMPALWVHNIRNVGETDLITLFWSDQLLDPRNPDQFPETIAQEAFA